MDVRAYARFVRLSPTKARDIAAKIRGMSVAEALQITEFSERKGAFYVGKTLKSAIANAEKNHKLSLENLRVKSSVVEESVMMRRFKARARGSAGPIKKRLCHIKIILTDESK